MNVKYWVGLAAVTGLVACGGFAVSDSASVPANPVWETTVKGEPDVKTIMENHCNNCHGAKPNRGGGSYFRTDTYDNVGGRTGVHDMSGDFNDSIQGGEMPPGSGLGSNDLSIVQMWVSQGAPRTK